MVENYDGAFPTEKVKEGSAEVIVPKLDAFVSNSSEYAPSKAPVFYNPVKSRYCCFGSKELSKNG